MNKKQIIQKAFLILMLTLTFQIMGTSVSLATATNNGLAWETPLQNIMKSISGPVAQAICVIAIVLCGFGIAFGEGGAGLKKLLWIVMGISIAYGGATFITNGLGLSVGLLF